MKNCHLTRRRFTQISAALLAAAAVPARGAAVDLSKNNVCVFTKPFNSLSFDQLADEIARLGVAGVEAPIRPGGHIEPENVEEQLPRLVESLRQRDLEVTVMTSNINDPRDPLSERQLRTAAGLGIKRYRMGYFKYDPKQPILQQLQQWQPQVQELAALNESLGITGVYQNHAGRNYVGASIWDLQRLLDGIDPRSLAVAYDIRHATVEGGNSWPITFQMIRPHIDTVYVKDFVWQEERVHNVPLGEGFVDPTFFKMLAESEFTGPISLHEEYLDHRDPDLVGKHLEAIRHDLDTLRSWLS